EFGHLNIFGLEHHRAVRIADLTGGEAKRDVRIGRLSILGVAPLNLHMFLAPNCRTVGHRPFVFSGLVLHPPPLLELARRNPSDLSRPDASKRHRFDPGFLPRAHNKSLSQNAMLWRGLRSSTEYTLRGSGGNLKLNAAEQIKAKWTRRMRQQQIVGKRESN